MTGSYCSRCATHATDKLCAYSPAINYSVAEEKEREREREKEGNIAKMTGRKSDNYPDGLSARIKRKKEQRQREKGRTRVHMLESAVALLNA